MYPGVGAFVLIRPAQTFYERIKLAGCMGPVLREELLYLKGKGVRTIVRLEEHTVSGEAAGLVDMAEYVPDFEPPTTGQIGRIVAFIHEQMENDAPVAVSCKAGLGRTGTVLACYLVHTGYRAEDALDRVRRVRPGSAESPQQQEFVYMYEERLRKGRG